MFVPDDDIVEVIMPDIEDEDEAADPSELPEPSLPPASPLPLLPTGVWA